VEVLHVARVDIRALDLVLGAEALVGLGAGLDVLHLDLHERAAATADVHVVGLEDAPDALVPLEEISGTDPDCFDLGHDGIDALAKGRAFYYDLRRLQRGPSRLCRKPTSNGLLRC